MVNVNVRTLASHPALAAELHPTKNGALTAADIAHGSARAVWWRCARVADHEWRASPRERRNSKGCPFCLNRRVAWSNSLAALHPELASEWHSAKNKKLAPASVVPGSDRLVWWRCSRDPTHVWRQTIVARVRGRGCPYCAGKFVSADNCLAAVAPHLVAEWHPSRNGEQTPRDVVAGTPRKAWWRCSRDPRHAWSASVLSRVRGSGCPHCPRPGRGSRPMLADELPELAAQWHPTKNEGLSFESLTAGSNRRVWWKCPQGPDHEWQAPAVLRAREVKRLGRAGCPFCSNRRVSATNHLAAVRPDLAAEWHPRLNRLSPEQVIAGSNTKVWWKCPEGDDHEWLVSCRQRSVVGTGCPFCANKRVATDNTLAAQEPELAREWHPTKNGHLLPSDVLAGTNRSVFWRCAEGHTFRMKVTHRTTLGRGCPRCARAATSERAISARQVVRSVADYPAVAAQWHPKLNGELTPSQVPFGSPRSVWWRCPHGPDHVWSAPVSDRINKDAGCPFCAGKRVSVTNSLATRFPRIAREWHPTKNAPLTPEDVTYGTGVRYWWRCILGHDWRVSPANRVGGGILRGCPYCRPRKKKTVTVRTRRVRRANA